MIGIGREGRDGAILPLSGGHKELISGPAMGQGHQGSKGGSQGTGDPRNQLGLEAMLPEVKDLLAAPAEDEGIAILEADDVLAGTEALQSYLHEGLLAAVGLAGVLGGGEVEGAADGGEEGRGDEVVCDDKVCLLQQPMGPHCQ